MIRRAMRLVCAVLGHGWLDPRPVEAGHLYEAACARCDLTIKGDWDHIEAHGAWRHYRSWRTR